MRGGKLIGEVGWKAGPATMASRAMGWGSGKGRCVLLLNLVQLISDPIGSLFFWSRD